MSSAATRTRPLVLMAVTIALATTLHVLCAYFFGVRLLDLTVWGLIPVGALGLFVLASGGYYAGTVSVGLQVTRLDLLIMMMANLAIIPLAYLSEYVVFPSSSPSFLAYMIGEITQAKQTMHFRGMPTTARSVSPGDAGWLLLIVKISLALAVAKVLHTKCPQSASARWSFAQS